MCQLTVELLTRTGHGDDITTLAAQRLIESVPPLHVELPAERASVTTVRRAFGQWLDQVDAAAQDRGQRALRCHNNLFGAVLTTDPAD